MTLRAFGYVRGPLSYASILADAGKLHVADLTPQENSLSEGALHLCLAGPPAAGPHVTQPL